MKNYLLYTVILGGAALAFTGCSDWLDVNQNPNDALESTVSSDLLLTSVQMYSILFFVLRKQLREMRQWLSW